MLILLNVMYYSRENEYNKFIYYLAPFSLFPYFFLYTFCLFNKCTLLWQILKLFSLNTAIANSLVNSLYLSIHNTNTIVCT